MDCNLKKMAKFFKFFPFVLEKLLYTIVSTFVWFVQLNSPKHGKIPVIMPLLGLSKMLH